MNERTLEVVKAMAGYEVSDNDYGNLDCGFCSYEEYGKGHEENCPVLLAQQIIADLTSNEPQA